MMTLGYIAVYFTGTGGGVVLELDVRGREAVFTMSDTGIGIRAENLPRVFDRFYRVPGTDASPEGSGLGLAIVKRIVEAHDGSIEAASRIGEGSTFTVRLPLAR